MKALYRIKNAFGVLLCYQVAENEKDAIRLAKDFYGFGTAKQAEFIRYN